MEGSDYRERAERALGRRLESWEVVHHHSETQLVICDRAYHGFLHSQMKRRGIPNPVLPFRTGVERTLRLSEWAWKRLHWRAREEGRPPQYVLEDALALYSAYQVEMGINRAGPRWQQWPEPPGDQDVDAAFSLDFDVHIP